MAGIETVWQVKKPYGSCTLMVIDSAYIQIDNQQAGTSAYIIADVAQGVHSTLYILLAKTPLIYHFQLIMVHWRWRYFIYSNKTLDPILHKKFNSGDLWIPYMFYFGVCKTCLYSCYCLSRTSLLENWKPKTLFIFCLSKKKSIFDSIATHDLI